MKNRKIISLTFILVFLCIFASISESKAVTYSGNIILASGKALCVNERMSVGSEIEWRLARRGDGNIYVYALDQGNFDLFKNGHATYSLYL